MTRRSALETTLETRFVKRMTECGWLHAKLDLITRGMPDQVFWGKNGTTVFVEFKRAVSGIDHRKGVALQRYWSKRLKARGFEYFRVIGQLAAENLFHRLTGEALYGRRVRSRS